MDLRKWRDLMGIGYMTKKEFFALASLASDQPDDATLVNIGAGAGTSGIALALGNFSAQRWTVDIHQDGPLGSLQGETNAFRGLGMDHLIPNQLLGDSVKVASRWQAPIDLIFIDAGHQEEQIQSDMDAWLPHVRGVAVYHDYEYQGVWADVKVVVDRYYGNKKPLIRVDTLIAFSHG